MINLKILLMSSSLLISFACTSNDKKAVTELKMCTQEFAPVCAQPPMPECPAGRSCMQVMPEPKTYSNKCMMENAKAKFIREGECKKR